MRKVDIRHGEGSMITIIFRQGDVGVAAHVSRKKRSADIDNLQAVAGDKQPGGDMIERQRLAEKLIIHAIVAIDFDLQPCVFAATKLVEAVCRNDWWASKL